jgi:hypothetical protein
VSGVAEDLRVSEEIRIHHIQQNLARTLPFWAMLAARHGLSLFDALVMLTQGEPWHPPPRDQSTTI